MRWENHVASAGIMEEVHDKKQNNEDNEEVTQLFIHHDEVP